MTSHRSALVLATSLSMSTGAHAIGQSVDPDRSRVWFDRPWEIRYVLFVDTDHGMNSWIRSARTFNATPAKPGRTKVYLSAEEMYETTATYKVPRHDPVAMVLIQFDRAGHATSAGHRVSRYTGKRSMLDALVLVSTNSEDEKPYFFAHWRQGIPGDVTFSPAVCAGYDSLRYDKDWEADSYIGDFGCREWTAQLNQSERPYIDVTSYSKHGNFIGEFVGWSRFTDPAKPVIGLHGKTWLCLHDCPAGEKPGVIPSIKAWTAKHAFPMPVRPPKQPLYPNSNYKDDLNE